MGSSNIAASLIIFYMDFSSLEVHFVHHSHYLLELLWNHVVFMLMSYREGAEEGLTFAFRFTDASMSISNQGMFEIYDGYSSFLS